MQRDTNGNERAPDVASRGDGENQSRYHEQIAVPFSRNENPNQALHEDMPDISHEAHDEAGSITEGPLEAPPHLRRMLHSTVQPLTEETEVKKVHDSVRDVSPSKTANRSAMLLQFEQDMLAKAQVTVPVSTAGKRAPFPVPFSSGNSASSAPASDDATENPSLTADYNSTSHLESLKSSDRDHRSGSIEHLCDDQESSEDGMDASATQSAPGDVENVTRAIITIRAAEDGTNASTVSAPGDVENVTRFGPSESLMKAPGLFEDSPPFILPYSDEERTDSSSMSSFGDVENAHRSIPLDSSDATLVSGHEDTQIHNVDDSSVAVAVPVSSEGDDERLSARRIFPDAKNPVWKGARLYFWLLVGCVVLVAIGSVTVAVTLTLKAQAGAPSAAPTTFAEGSDAYSSIVTLVGESALSLDSPAGQAAYWILYEDEMGLTESSESFIQRYLLSLFYFATTQKTSWRSCSRSARLDEQNCTFEKVVGIQLVGDVYTPVFGKSESARWLSPVHECAWGGVSCDPNDKVAGLELTGQGIDGTLPTEISLLPNLLTLYLSWNSFSGTLPSELIKLSTLILLELDSNHFTGSIPQQWTEFRQIQEINVGNNSLTGTWSTQFNDLKSLKGLFLHENQFKGTLPTEIGLLTDLVYMRLSRNQFTGTLPSELGSVLDIDEMWLHRNEFTGTIPSELGNMSRLRDLRLHFNKLNGTIPEEFFGMSQLTRLDVYDQNLTDTISTKIGTMNALATFRVRNNHFHGTIPTELGLLTSLQEVWLHGNDFTGSIPFNVCALRAPHALSILIADCTPDGSVPPIVECILGCCTICCVHSDILCEEYD